MDQQHQSSLTVGELRQYLSSYAEDAEIVFAGGLTFNRLKKVGPNLVNLQFRQFEAILSPRFKKKHPSVIVAFCRDEWTGEHLVQEFSVPEL